MKKWKIGLICGIIWGVISLYFWMMMFSGGPTSSAIPTLAFPVLSLPASIPILASYYIEDIIDLPGSFVVCLIPITGALIGVVVGHLVDKFKK